MTDIGRHREVGLNLVSEAPGVKKRVRTRSMAGTHIVRFISGIWQMHVLGEGNTRTTVESLIKHLRSFGFEVKNECFEKHSWFFRNAPVRPQYDKISKVFTGHSSHWSSL